MDDLKGSTATEALIAKAQAGDRQAFDALERKHRSRLESLIWLGLRQDLRQEADEVYQIMLFRAFKDISKFQWRGPGSFLRWLARIAERVILDVVRGKKKRNGELVLVDGMEFIGTGTSPSKKVERDERFARLVKALDSLPPHYREVIILAIVQRLPRKVIAARMHRDSPGAVSVLLGRALRELRRIFGDTESLGLPRMSLDEPSAETTK